MVHDTRLCDVLFAELHVVEEDDVPNLKVLRPTCTICGHLAAKTNTSLQTASFIHSPDRGQGRILL